MHCGVMHVYVPFMKSMQTQCASIIMTWLMNMCLQYACTGQVASRKGAVFNHSCLHLLLSFGLHVA